MGRRRKSKGMWGEAWGGEGRERACGERHGEAKGEKGHVGRGMGRRRERKGTGPRLTHLTPMGDVGPDRLYKVEQVLCKGPRCDLQKVMRREGEGVESRYPA